MFRLTQKLSTEFPKQVFNSPLAESTILGVACGLASYGKRPVFELQFIDFIWPAWNQLVTNLSNLRWRSFGTWKCPAVIYAPYGAYLPGGSLWHSQANEAALAHFPGINVAIPSTPEDAAGLLVDGDACRRSDVRSRPETFALGRARIERAGPRGAVRSGAQTQSGSDVTARRVGQHRGEIARSTRENRRRGQRRVDRSALDRPVGQGGDRGIGRAKPAGSLSSRKTARIAASVR